MYVCMYVSTYILHIYTYTHRLPKLTYIIQCMQSHLHMCTYRYIYKFTYTHTYIQTYIHIYIHTYIHTYMYMNLCSHSRKDTFSDVKHMMIINQYLSPNVHYYAHNGNSTSCHVTVKLKIYRGYMHPCVLKFIKKLKKYLQTLSQVSGG